MFEIELHVRIGHWNYFQLVNDLLSEFLIFIFFIGRVNREDIVPLKLNGYQHSLIVGTDIKPEEETKEMIF